MFKFYDELNDWNWPKENHKLVTFQHSYFFSLYEILKASFQSSSHTQAQYLSFPHFFILNCRASRDLDLETEMC